MIDATKPAVTLPKQRARFDKAMPPNFDFRGPRSRTSYPD
jgi:hypothetical protein